MSVKQSMNLIRLSGADAYLGKVCVYSDCYLLLYQATGYNRRR